MVLTRMAQNGNSMKSHYGKTFWGQQWLNAFNGIDYSNRLPRGRTYANKGAVFNVVLKAHQLTAKVQGSRRTPYNIKIQQGVFTHEQQAAILATIQHSPVILSQLMSRQLPETLLKNLAQQNIELFPRDWGDIEAQCSCPDWAVPCKHLAAGIYMMATRIDQNPFLVFENRGFDLLDAIEKAGILKTEASPVIPEFNTWLTDVITTEPELLAADNVDSIAQTIDFSIIQDVSSQLDTLLKTSPPFYARDFKSLYFAQLKQAKIYADRIVQNSSLNTYDDKPFGQSESWRSLQLILNDNFEPEALCHQDAMLFDNKSSCSEATLNSELIDWLNQLPVDRLNQHCQTVRFLHLLNQFVLKLLARQAVVPALYQINAAYSIRWQPALFDTTINATFHKLARLCPASWLITSASLSLTRYQQTLISCSFLIQHYFSLCCPAAIHKLAGDTAIDLFFSSSREAFDDFIDINTPASIHHWLARLTAHKSTHHLQLSVKEKDDDFTLALQVINTEQKRQVMALGTFLERASQSNTETEAKADILADVALLCDYLPEMAEVIDHPRQQTLTVNLETFSPILLRVLPALKVLGMGVVLPKSLQKLLKPALTLQLSADKKLDSNNSYLNLEQLLAFDWRMTIGDKNVDIESFKALLSSSRGLVRLMDEYVLLDEAAVQALLKQLENLPTTLNHAQLLQAALTDEYQGAIVKTDEAIQNLMTRLSSYQVVNPPANLQATLRPYQQSGFSWLVQNANLGFGSLLADDMGLGKTLQVIAVLQHFKNNGQLEDKKALVVAPTTLLSNWQQEIARFAPSLNTQVYHGQKRMLAQTPDVLITSYGLARRDKAKLNQQAWVVLVIDEAQQIKNPQSAQSKSIKSLQSDYRIALSGTPVENHLMEYWSLFDFTNAGYLGDAKGFKKDFANPIENERDQSCLMRFQKITAPFILRRLKSDSSIIQDLPNKIETDQICSLTKEQTALYQEVVNMTLEKIEQAEGINRKGLIFKLINALKQICNHPAQYLKEGDAAIEQSGKLSSAIALLDAIHTQSEKTLIFTQYAQMGHLLADVLSTHYRQPVPFLHGGISVKKRAQLVQDFQQEEQTKILIVSLKAGGTGLNLTAANHVIHYDLWWNPAVEAQATDRAYRIGQKKNVMVHRLITEGTFEEKINNMIQKKKELADLSVASGETWLTEFDDGQLRELFQHI